LAACGPGTNQRPAAALPRVKPGAAATTALAGARSRSASSNTAQCALAANLAAFCAFTFSAASSIFFAQAAALALSSSRLGPAQDSLEDGLHTRIVSEGF